MSANRIVILEVEPKFDAHYIANVFWRKDIGKVSSITLLPQINGDKITNIAYVNFDSFFDTEAASEFIESMKCDGSMFCHSYVGPEYNVWIIEKNTHHEGELCVGPYTRNFGPDYFESFTTGDPSFLGKTVGLNGLHYIVGLDSKPYHIDEALQHLWYLDEQAKTTGNYEDLIDEIYHFEVQIALHYISRGQAEPIMYDILKSLDVIPDERKIDVRREVAMDRNEYDAMQKYIEYCKQRVDFMHQMQNPTNVQRQYANGSLDHIDWSLSSVSPNADESLPPPPSPIFQRETAMTNAEIAELLQDN